MPVEAARIFQEKLQRFKKRLPDSHPFKDFETQMVFPEEAENNGLCAGVRIDYPHLQKIKTRYDSNRDKLYFILPDGSELEAGKYKELQKAFEGLVGKAISLALKARRPVKADYLVPINFVNFRLPPHVVKRRLEKK